MAKVKIGGIIQNKNLAQISVLGLPAQTRMAAEIFNILGEEGINVQFIVLASDALNEGNVAFCVDQGDFEKTLKTLQAKLPESSSRKVIHHFPVAIVSIFGPHFREKPALAGKMFSTLAKAEINILAISTSISTLSCVIPEAALPQAVQVLSEEFELP